MFIKFENYFLGHKNIMAVQKTRKNSTDFRWITNFNQSKI